MDKLINDDIPEGVPEAFANKRATGKLREFQLTELELMKEFVKVCERNNLTYYLLGGTLLGAIRHRGFIPWDDDVDLCMPRPDYMRFLEIAEAEYAGSDMKVVSVYHDEGYRQGMAKVTTSRMQIINRSASVEHVEDAWIDIIPLDGFPDGTLASFAHKIRLNWWKVMDATTEFEHVVDVKRDRGFVGNVAVKVLGFLCKFIHPYGRDSHKVFMKMERALQRYAYDDSSRVVNLYAARGFREIFPRESLAAGVPVRFEGEVFMAPAQPRVVLDIIYGGDYLSPPPEDERNYHNSEVL